jgi:uncharacterized protein (DUF433 family)
MTTAMDGHIVMGEDRVARIAGSRSRVIDVALDQKAHGMTPEQIRQEYPHLSLAQIHAALAFYYDHQRELDAEIARRLHKVSEIQKELGDAPVAKRLRALRKQP